MSQFSTEQRERIVDALTKNTSLDFFLPDLNTSKNAMWSWVTYSHPDDTGRSSLEITYRDDGSYRLEIVLEEDHAVTTRGVFVRVTNNFDDIVAWLSTLTAVSISGDMFRPVPDPGEELSAE